MGLSPAKQHMTQRRHRNKTIISGKIVIAATLFIMAAMAVLHAHGANARTPRFYSRFERFTSAELYNMGKDYLDKRGMADSALVCFTIITNRNEAGHGSDADDRTYVNALNQMANIYSGYYNRFDLADECVDMAITRAKERGLKDRLPYLLGNRANVSYIYESLNGNKKAENEYAQNLKEVFWSSIKVKEWKCAETAYYNMALHALNEGNFSEIARETREFAKLRTGNGDEKHRLAQLYCKLVEAFGRKDYDECKRLLLSNIPAKTTAKNIYSTTMMRIELAMLYRRTGQQREAHEQLDTIEELANNSSSLTLKYSIYDLFTEFWRRAGNEAMAEQYDYKRLLVKEQLNDGNNLIDVKQQRFLRELGQVRDELTTETVRRQAMTTILIIVCVALVIIAILLAVLFRSYRRQSRYVDLLYRRNQQLLKSQQLLVDDEDKVPPAPKQRQAELPDGIVESIDGVMRQTDVICSRDFSMAKLCDMTGYSRTYVSQAIRQKYGTNFNGLLNSYRIKEACSRMNDYEHYGHLTIEAIADSLGYASRTNFSAVFKRITGLSATEYMKRNNMEH